MSPTKTDKKKGARKKPTQLDRIHKDVRGHLLALEEKIDLMDTRLRTITSYEKLQEAMADHVSDAKKEEQGKRRLKIGDHVTSPNSYSSVFQQVHRIESDFPCNQFKLSNGEWHSGDSLRLATPEEIESSAYGEREGLFDGAACDANAEEANEIAKVLYDAGLIEKERSYGTRTAMFWRPDESPKLTHALTLRDGRPHKAIPASTFLRLAKKEAEKLRAAREEEEAKKKLVFGQWVKSAITDRKYRVACDGPDQDGDYTLVPQDGGIVHMKRSEFTVLNN